MKVTSEQLRLYAVTDRRGLKDISLAQAVEKAIEGGVTFVQIREKNADYDEFKRVALEVKRVTDRYGIPLVINDNVALCRDINADGVHLGAEDMSPREARKILGEGKIIGATARTLERAVEAYEQGADYLGIGAVFATSTKEGTTHMTKEAARAINAAVDIPTVAIGGINEDNIAQLKGYGISGVAVVSAIFSAEDIKKAAHRLSELTKEI